MSKYLLAIAAVAGCGRWHFDDVERGGADASVDIGAMDSGPSDALGSCDRSAPFGTPVLIAELSSPAAADGTLRLAPDELSGYFWSRRTGLSRIYYAERISLAAPFNTTQVAGLNTTNNDLDPTLSTDGSVLVFRHNIPGDELWSAQRLNKLTFTGAAAITSLNTASVETEPYLQEGGNVLLFQSDRTGGNFDIWQSTRTGNTFSAPMALTELDAAGSHEGDPVISGDGLTLYFRSDRPAALAGFNIYVSTRGSTASAWGAPALVPNVNSTGDDGPSFVSSDGCRLYISSDRLGTNDIFVATRGT